MRYKSKALPCADACWMWYGHPSITGLVHMLRRQADHFVSAVRHVLTLAFGSPCSPSSSLRPSSQSSSITSTQHSVERDGSPTSEGKVRLEGMGRRAYSHLCVPSPESSISSSLSHILCFPQLTIFQDNASYTAREGRRVGALSHGLSTAEELRLSLKVSFFVRRACQVIKRRMTWAPHNTRPLHARFEW